MGRSPFQSRLRTIALGWMAAAVLLGCTSDKPKLTSKPRKPRLNFRGGTPAELHLFGNPVAMNLDGIPGPDGIGVRIFASASGRAVGLPITQGTLEILLFDGVLAAQESAEPPQPLKVWTFNPQDLKGYQAETSLGAGYQFALQWGPERPRQVRVTVIARLRLPNGSVLASDSSSISVNVK